ncbi:MAG: hypothetical protein NTW96_25085 [Planctomycetia bacterium]|nr:hypothetical protein [Planctomycetia bacterium]
MIEITKSFVRDKAGVLSYYRNRAAESLQEVCRLYAASQKESRAGAINRQIGKTAENLIQAAVQKATVEKWSKDETLRAVLMLTYSNFVAMLESRNDVWPYEYMAFSRRIGELWERFCKLCFDYPLNNLEYFVPPLFAEVQRQLQNEIENYISQLTISEAQKRQLLQYYRKAWSLVTSGEVKLELDLHFRLDNRNYDVDFKSGFGSNEKGNTNRLLLVATIYKNLEDNHICVLLVRSQEDRNNHYFQTLKNSSVWEAYCGADAYRKICDFSGFDIQAWIQENIDWRHDLKPETFKHFCDNNLDQYLSW